MYILAILELAEGRLKIVQIKLHVIVQIKLHAVVPIIVHDVVSLVYEVCVHKECTFLWDCSNEVKSMI